MASNIIKAFFASDDDGGEDGEGRAKGEGGAPEGTGGEKPRSLADAWDRIAEQNRRLEERLAALEAGQKSALEATQALQETAKQQLEVLKYLGRFAEASERRGREMEAQFRGIPDVLRTLPSATKEQAERLSEIAARLYEKAQDNTVNALRSAQATHQRSIEDLIERSLGKSQTATWAAIATALAAVGVAFAMWMKGGG